MPLARTTSLRARMMCSLGMSWPRSSGLTNATPTALLPSKMMRLTLALH